MSGKPFAQAGDSEKLDARFSRLMTTIVSPLVEDFLHKYSLLFSENLSSSTRLFGIDPYIDFIRKLMTGQRLNRTQYRTFGPAPQSRCPQFIETCLIRFNEDLLDIADSNVAVRGAVEASPLEIYAEPHPFAQAMEHL
ncbi:unnamed protein product, partial [Tuber aestivum]